MLSGMLIFSGLAHPKACWAAKFAISLSSVKRFMEQMVVKSIAGFMNAEGGTLMIGVTDAGEIFGIEADYKTLGKKQDRDGFALWLDGLLDNILGPTAASGVRLTFEEHPEGTTCRVDVDAAKRPTFVKGSKGDADLYVRLNNATRLLNTAEALEYVSTRWR
jgi:ATP-dependent Lon protease